MFQALNKSPKDQTVLIQSHTSDAHIQVPQTIKWSEVALPTEWTLVTESQPAPIQRSLNNLDYIQQYLDGSVKIRFENQPLNKSSVQLQQLPTPGQSQRHVSARHSFTASSSTLERDLELERDMIDFKLKSLRKSSQVNQPCYGKVPIQDDNTSSPESPTQSDFVVENFATVDKQLRTLNQKFKINWKFLNNHLKAPENKPRRDSYHLAYPDSENRQEIFEEWKDYMRSAKVEIFYLDFVESRYMSSELKTLTKEKWKMIDQTEVESSHPPVDTIVISHKGTPIPASPFKIFDSGDPNRKLIEQNNYANQSLIVIGKQLDTIETKIDKISSSETKSKTKVEKPIVQFQDLKSSPTLKIKPTMKKIEEMLEQLTPSKTEKGEKSGLKTLDSFPTVDPSESEPETIESESSDISKIERAFRNLEVQVEPRIKRLDKHISPTSLTKNWYPRPTPPDIQFEERNFQTQFSVSSDKLYEWNIDGLSEQEIFNKLQHMSMVANSYVTNHSFRQSEIVPLLVTGFTGTLRYWWDKHLTPESKNLIIHAVKLNEDGLPIFDEQIGQGIEDGVNTLFYTIIEHFVGTPSNTTARIHDQLSNLRCPKLSDFMWYKGVFISRVMLRDDSNQPFWKEKFVNGLPNLFAHKIRTTLSNEQGHIDWDSLTYGNIISTINQVDYDGVISTYLGEHVKFEFLSKPELHNLKALQKQSPLFDRLQSNPPTWSTIHTDIVKQIKAHVKTLPCLGIPSVESFKIVETDASDIGYGGILKQRISSNSPEQIRVFAGCTMAPKKDKQKESAKQPKPSQSPSQSLRILPPSMSQSKTETPKQLVPYPSCTPISVAPPISVANQFSALGSTVGQIRPSYQSTLISSYDPFSASSSVAFKKTSPYLPKSNFHLFVIEPNYNINSEPVAIARHYFPPGFHYMPPSPYKSLKYYRDILLETQSVEIKPIKDRDHPEIILYHSLYIHRIISQESFSSHPYELKSLRSKLQYNYSDYIEAWYSIFLHQSEDFSHSWFINFDNKFKSPFPCWFLHWWEKHGPADEILPVSVLELIRHFTKKAKFSQVELFFPKQLLFVARYKVPWILKWSYRVTKDSRIFARQFSVKWWDKFEVDRIAKYVYNDLPEDPIPHPRQRPTSPADSVRSSLSVEGKSKSKLQEIARQLIIQASQMDDDEENDSDKDSPSPPSCQPMQQSPAKPKSWYEDSQDPYDAYDLGSD
ncbi:unnamed protein product [Prunus brigantina]